MRLLIVESQGFLQGSDRILFEVNQSYEIPGYRVHPIAEGLPPAPFAVKFQYLNNRVRLGTTTNQPIPR